MFVLGVWWCSSQSVVMESSLQSSLQASPLFCRLPRQLHSYWPSGSAALAATSKPLLCSLTGARRPVLVRGPWTISASPVFLER